MDLQYPIGKFQWPQEVTAADRERYIGAIEAAPALLREAVQGLSDAQLDVPYRPAGWTARQVVHHVVDSHMNSYMRYKLALTESEPVIKPYDQSAWAALPDSALPVDVSLTMLDGLHRRWVHLLRAMREEDFARVFVHPELGRIRLDENLSLYAWHGQHHTAHVRNVGRAFSVPAGS